MAVDVTALTGGALGGAVVQSILGPLFGQRHERRELRAKVLRKIAAVEDTHWVPAKKEAFLESANELSSLALVAGINRRAVELYLVVAAAAREKSEESLDRAGGDLETGGGVRLSLSQLARDAAAFVTDCVWHPHLQRPLIRLRLRRLEVKKKQVTAEMDKPHERIYWNQGLPLIVLAGRSRSSSD